MSQSAKVYKRRQSTPSRHSKKIARHDVLSSVHPGALLLLRRLGRELVVAETGKLSAFALEGADENIYARLEWEVELPQPPAAIAATIHGILVAWNQDGRTLLVLAEGGRLTRVANLAGTLTALTASRTDALLATQECGAFSGHLWRIDVHRCAVTAELPLPNARVDLQVDVNGQWLTIVDKAASTVTTTPTSLAGVPLSASGPSNAPVAPADSPGHQATCCCCVCRPSGQNAGSQPGTPAGGPPGSGGNPPGGSTPSGTTPGGVQTGTAGVPTGNGGSVVGQGGRVGHHDPGDDGTIPCSVDLLWQVDRLLLTAGFVVATDAAARNLAVMAFEPFRVVEERQFGRAPFRMALDREAPVMLVRDLARQEWTLLHLDVASALDKAINAFLPPILEAESATFYGVHIESLLGGHAPTKGPIKALLFPIIEKSQIFSSGDISNWAEYLDRTMVPAVLDYYTENSFGQLHDVTFQTFGRDVGPKAGPIQLPRHYLSDYYWDKWDPAKLILTRTNVPAGAEIVLDGREFMTIGVQPDGGLPAETVDVGFAALAFVQDHDLFPVQVRFDAADTLALEVTTPAGSSATLNLKFTAKTIDIDRTNVAAKLHELETYLDGILLAAETAAKLPKQPMTKRLFGTPVAHRIAKSGLDFGRLAVTVGGAATLGPQLAVRSAIASVAGTDPLGMNSALVGTIAATSAPELQAYINLMLDLSREAKGFDESTRRLDDASVSFDGGTLTTKIPISVVVGGPAASLSLKPGDFFGLNDLFTTSAASPNSATTFNNSQAMRDADALFTDVFTAATQRLLDAGRDPKQELAGWHVAMLIPVDEPVNDPADSTSVQPWENWAVTPLFKPITFRGVETFGTVSYRKDKSVQLKSVWTLDFFTTGNLDVLKNGRPDVALICHELGHGVGFRDLYWQTGYREDLAYLDKWAIMSSHPNKPHHSGYHKFQADWITADRMTVIPPTEPSQTTNTEVLLVPVELWDSSYPADARAAFGTGPDMPVVQLVRLDLGGDGAVYDLIEARQKGAHFSQNLPAGAPGILITNAIEPWDDQRYAFNGNYRRELQLLNPANILSNPGDSFDLAKAAGLSAKGIVVTVVDRKLVRDANIFRIKVTRTNTDFIDLYFSNADPYYQNTDLWVDWAGDNPSKDPKDHDEYPLGKPRDQGETIHVPHAGTELHWVVARLRNRGHVHAENVRLNFKIFLPPGGGDRNGNFQSIGTTTIADMPGDDVPVSSPLAWQVPAGFHGHTCLAVEIKDYKIPKDSDGAALASDDVWVANNHAQKNVDEFVPLQASPYEVTEFDYGVHNDAPRPEYAYLEPDGLPYGMKLTVTPPLQLVPPKSTVLFHCKLELDDKIIDAGCRSDRQFRLVTWRRDPESTTKWGGVQYKVRPRKRCAVSITGFWTDGIQITGSVSPNPGGGVLRLRLAFDGIDAVWVPLSLATGGTYVWKGQPPLGQSAST